MDWFRQALVGAHRNQRAHMFFVLQNLTDDELKKEITTEDYSRSIIGIVMHIGTAETYWFHKAKESIGPPVIVDTVEEAFARIRENTARIEEKVLECPKNQLRIIPPTKESGPSIAWAVLRTAQHGIYHSGQIAKIRRIIGASELGPDIEDTWSTAADSLIQIIKKITD